MVSFYPYTAITVNKSQHYVWILPYMELHAPFFVGLNELLMIPNQDCQGAMKEFLWLVCGDILPKPKPY